MPTKSEFLYRDSAGYHTVDLTKDQFGTFKPVFTFVDQVDPIAVKKLGTLTITDTDSIFTPAMDKVCAAVASRFNRKRGAYSFTWEHIAERLEIRQVLHAFGWPRTPFAELLKRQARAIRANA